MSEKPKQHSDWPDQLRDWLTQIPIPQDNRGKWHKLNECLTSLGEQMKTLAQDRSLSEKLQQENAQLRENQFEQQVLNPLFRTVISILDRCDQSIDQATQKLKKLTGKTGVSQTCQALRTLLEARKADRVELTALLMQYGVEAYREPESVFNPRTQQCLDRVPTSTQSEVNHIAERLRCGYRMDKRIIRSEQVSVLVFTPTPTPEPSERTPTLESPKPTPESTPEPASKQKSGRLVSQPTTSTP